MKRKTLMLLFIALLAVPAMNAQDFERTFVVFLTGLVNRNEELKNLAMPDMETHTVPEMGDQALYVLDFKTEEDVNSFLSALKKENIPYGSFPEKKLRLVLFYDDMMAFIFRTIIGL
jgi:hypothetical protein